MERTSLTLQTRGVCSVRFPSRTFHGKQTCRESQRDRGLGHKPSPLCVWGMVGHQAGELSSPAMQPLQHQFLQTAAAEATAAGHIFPEMAAAEAALESGYGASELARECLNLFGTKQHIHPIYGTVRIPTKEYIHDAWETVSAEWVKYPTLASCFADRMLTLRRMAASCPHYRDALAAKDPVSYIRAVSQTWSTDPTRADKVLGIYNAR